jgi:hypothetical protein
MKRLEINATVDARIIDLPTPKYMPLIRIITVTGWIFGSGSSNILPATAKIPRRDNTIISLCEDKFFSVFHNAQPIIDRRVRFTMSKP